jgi:hypothetical protein
MVEAEATDVDPRRRKRHRSHVFGGEGHWAMVTSG